MQSHRAARATSWVEQPFGLYARNRFGSSRFLASQSTYRVNPGRDLHTYLAVARAPPLFPPSTSVPGGDTAGGLGGDPTRAAQQEASFQPLNGYDYSKPEPLARAPKNVFVFRGKEQQVLGWRNVFDLPIQYDVELCPGLLSPESATLSHRFLPEDGPLRRFVVIGETGLKESQGCGRPSAIV